MREIWKEISYTNGAYSVSSLGRIRRDKPGKSTHIGKILKFRKNKKGYMYFNVHLNGRGKVGTVHRLVAVTFLGEPRFIADVNHIDGNKENNRLDNLEFTTSSENAIHAFKNGLRKAPKGEKCGTSVLTSKEVLEIRSKYIKGINQHKTGYGSIKLAKEYNVGQSTVLHIINRRTWSHI